MTNKKEINYGDTDQIDGDLSFDDAKIKISMFIDGDVLKAIKNAAKMDGAKYQTLINKTLREVFVNRAEEDNIP